MFPALLAHLQGVQSGRNM